MNRIYLKNLGLNEEDWPDTIYSKKPGSDDRYKMYKDLKEETGVFNPECWNLDSTAMMWLYERLMVYKLDASKNVDLTYHSFDFKGHNYSQEELIDDMIDLAEYVLAKPENVKNTFQWALLMDNPYRFIYNNFVKKYQPFEDYFKDNCSKRFWEIWSVIYPSMWW